MRTKRATKKTLVDQATELVEQVTPHVEAARERIVNDYLPAAQVALADAGVAARQAAQDAREAAVKAEKSTRKSRRRAAKNATAKARSTAETAKSTAKGMATAAAATPAAVALAEKVRPESDKPSRKKRFLLLFGLLGAGAVLFKKLRGDSSTGAAYSPAAKPSPRPTPVADPLTTASAPPGSTSESLSADPDAPAGESADKGGAFFDEAAADAADGPHPVTTPDQPAETEDVSGVPDPKHA